MSSSLGAPEMILALFSVKKYQEGGRLCHILIN
jgi:hypothetical protein